MAYETPEMVGALSQALDTIGRHSRYADDAKAEELISILNDIIELSEEAKAAARTEMMRLQKAELETLRASVKSA